MTVRWWITFVFGEENGKCNQSDKVALRCWEGLEATHMRNLYGATLTVEPFRWHSVKKLTGAFTQF